MRNKTLCSNNWLSPIFRSIRLLSFSLLIGFASFLFSGQAAFGEDEKPDLKRGKQLYAICSSCHGAEGYGNQSIKAPALAGLTDWYIVQQVEKFQNGLRGAHPADTAGLLMRPMSRTLKNKKDLASVAAYIASLKPVIPEVTITDGDPAKGQGLYVMCVGCHGDKLQGNEQLRTAPLRFSNDWYQLDQLKKYKSGIRGADPSDVQALQMKAITATLPDEEAMKNVIAYISKMVRKD